MTKLTETVTVTREVPKYIADLVHFAKRLAARHHVDLRGLTDEKLIAIARDFWQVQHGDDE